MASMRKAYFAKRHPVGKIRNESQWDSISLDKVIAYCPTIYMNGVFLEHLPSDGPILEAGCGLGYYVIYYKDLGYQIYGLEWVSEALRKTKLYRPDVGVLAGDVDDLPFKDKTFKMVFSGGVLEHFESGPEQALSETHRILDDDGLFLVRVPCLNALRRLEDFLNFTLRKKPLKRTIRNDGREMVYLRVETLGMDGTPPDGYHFYQYFFTRSGLISILEQSGFEVLKAHGAAIETGFFEIPGFRYLYRRFWPPRKATVQPPSSAEAGQGGSSTPGTPSRPSLRQRLKKLVVSEAADSLPSRVILRLLRSILGVHLVVLCRKLPQEER